MLKFYRLHHNSTYLKPAGSFFFCAFIVLCCIFFPGQAQAQNKLDNIGLPFTKSVGAYSVRKLSSTYAGKALKVRRSSNNDSTDIGFTVGGDLDTTALLTFVGTGILDTGYITTWYDQSGNARNLKQSVKANQPRIITAGVLELNGPRPALKFGGGTQNLTFVKIASSPFFNTSYPVTISLLANTSGAITNGAFVKFGGLAGNSGIAIGIGSAGSSGKLTSPGTAVIGLKDKVGGLTSASQSSTNISYPATAFTSTTTQEAAASGNALTTYLNGSGIALFNSAASTDGVSVRDTFYIGGYNGINGGFPLVKESEVILFANTASSTDNAVISSSNRQDLECNQLKYYGLFKAIAGPTQAICNSFSSSPLGATTPLVGTGRWVQLSGPAGGITTFSSLIDANATATVSKMGAYIYAWEVSNGSCLATANDTVTYTASPTVGINQNICGGLVSNTLGASPAPVGIGTWTKTSGPGNVIFNDANNSNATATVDADGSYVFRWTITGENCSANYAELTVKYNSSGAGFPTGVLSGTAAVCQGSTSNITINFTGTSPFNFSYTDGTQVFDSVSAGNSISIPITPSKITTYSLLALSDAGCTAQPANLSGTATISFNPAVTIIPDYCSFGGGIIKLDAGIHNSYVWNTGATSRIASVLQAGRYSVTVNDGGCPGTGFIDIGQELVMNGDFSQGNTGFVTEYQVPVIPLVCANLTTALYPEGYFDVKTDAQLTHCNFWGRDHTNPGTGKFMIVNGANSLTQIWKTNNVRVTPNTRYYFSAWAMSLNASAPFAAVTFLINGAQYGSTATLTAGINSVSNAGWTRFYGQWDSGSDTAATISIVNTNLSASGNDFGLDDISFSTVPPITFTANPLGNGGNSFCPGKPLNLTSNLLGGFSPFTYSWIGPNSFTSTAENPLIPAPGAAEAGTYTVTATDNKGCTATGNITIYMSSPSLSTATQVAVCDNAAVSIDLTGLPLNSQNDTIYYRITATGVIKKAIVDADATGNASFSITGLRNNPNNGQKLFIDSVSNGSCPYYTSLSLTLVINASGWVGGSAGNWSQASNWCPGLPTSITDIVVPGGTIIYINPGDAFDCRNININSPGTLKIVGGKLRIFGSVNTTTSGKIDAGQGVIEMMSGQTISGDNFVGGNISSLVLNTSATTTILSTGSPLRIVSALLLPNLNADLATNGNLIFGSSDTATARLGQVAAGNLIVGNATAERYYKQSRSWRLVTSPLSTTGSIFGNWQGGGAPYIAGKGMFITGPNPTGVSGNGLDYSNFNNYSMKGWIAATGAYNNIGDTKHTQLSLDSTAPGKACSIGYYAFVRGDRQRVPMDNTVYPNGNSTTLSSTGKLQTGTQKFDLTSGAGTLALIGNPYISSVDFSKLTMVNVDKTLFYTFDPSTNVVGTYITMAENPFNSGNYVAVPYSTQTKNIQSSQAFFVSVAGPSASVTFNESNKTTDYNPVLFRPVQPAGTSASLRINLYQKNQSNLQVDAVLEQFMDGLSEQVDNKDAIKLLNGNENLGIYRYNHLLAVERRPLLTANDTIFLQLSKTTQRSYQLEMVPVNLDPLLMPFLEDSYTGKSIPLNTSANSVYDFVITGDAKSSVVNRFRIVFKQAGLGPLPVSFKSITANAQATGIEVKWVVEDEINIKNYEVEKSADGLNFVKAASVPATAANRNSVTYEWLDENPFSGNNFYRVRSIGIDGKMDYTATVMVKMGNQLMGIQIYPNPVVSGIIGARFKNMPAGSYTVKLSNAAGQTILNKTVTHAPGTSMEYLQPGYKLPSGIYQLWVMAPDRQTTILKVVVK